MSSFLVVLVVKEAKEVMEVKLASFTLLLAVFIFSQQALKDFSKATSSEQFTILF